MTSRHVNCECGHSFEAQAERNWFECPKCNQSFMVFRRPSTEAMIKKWQEILGCSEQEAGVAVIEMLGKIAEKVKDEASEPSHE